MKQQANDRQMKKAQHHTEVIHQVKQDWPDNRAKRITEPEDNENPRNKP